jgi:hypothetical protein
MDKQTEILQETPPFFSKWSKLYVFIICFQLGLIAFFTWMTFSYA